MVKSHFALHVPICYVQSRLPTTHSKTIDKDILEKHVQLFPHHCGSEDSSQSSSTPYSISLHKTRGKGMARIYRALSTAEIKNRRNQSWIGEKLKLSINSPILTFHRPRFKEQVSGSGIVSKIITLSTVSVLNV
ncbi:uncharacterized protein [Gossypium hirsutum]|uniref:Uncharacterized protein n=1 Tax=Gossypium hirsutum TaxID=3635 RepID=A0ABM3AYS4_GOSHI|nr:uncharacterized protein LOC107913343 [Gossypium hirsutum]